MFKPDNYYVMYSEITYIDEHNLKTNEVTRLSTSWSENEFVDYSKGYVQLLSMALNIENVFILYHIKTGVNVGFYVNKFDHDLNLIEKIKINNLRPTSIATKLNNVYMTYRNNVGTNYVSRVNSSFEPQQVLQTDITDIFAYDERLYGFQRGTIEEAFYEINMDTSELIKIKQKTQRTGPDYGAQREYFYGYQYPGFLKYRLETGSSVQIEFAPKYDNYLLAALPTSDGYSRSSETIIVTESMFIVPTVAVTYPATEVGPLQEESGFVTYENFAPNVDLYTGR